MLTLTSRPSLGTSGEIIPQPKSSRTCVTTMPWNCSKLPTLVGKPPASCEALADGCMCSKGCPSTYACTPSALCSSARFVGASEPAAISAAAAQVPILLYLSFNASLVRHKYAKKPQIAYRRELNRIAYFVQSARRVGTQLPIFVVAGGERNRTAEAALLRLGVDRIIEQPVVEPPRWSSTFHRFSFSRIGALSLTQFRKVIVMDNDMVSWGSRRLAHLPAAVRPTSWSSSVHPQGVVLPAAAHPPARLRRRPTRNAVSRPNPV